jgi:cytochrome c peroxidase
MLSLRYFLPTMVLGLFPIAVPAQERTFKLPEKPYSYSKPEFPKHFDERLIKTMDNTPIENPTTDAGAALGRVLFYDTKLSVNNTTSCGICHRQEHAFAEPMRVSAGHQGKQGDRNSMSLVNLRFTRAFFFWDERALTLEEAVLLPIHSLLELGHDSKSLVKSVAADPRYVPLFLQAFGSKEVSEKRISQALAQFIRSLTSFDSKYDRAAVQAKDSKEDFAGFNKQENQGKTLFIERCNLCHHIGEEGKHIVLFSMFRTLANGLDPNRASRDGGHGDVTFVPGDVGGFRPSDLRNVAVTAPYMHDGRFQTLEEVMDHYAKTPGVRPSSGFSYSPEEKAALIAFMKTLTDEKFLADPRFSDPWTGPIIARPLAKTPSAVELPAETDPKLTPSERIAQGKGLKVGEALIWLKTLDANKNGSLEPEEWAVVAKILAEKNEGRIATAPGDAAPAPAGRGRGPRGAGPKKDNGSAKETRTKDGVLLGDFNRDGEVDETEARLFATFKRQIEMGDGGRLEVIMDRMLSRFNLSTEQLVAVREILRTAKKEQHRQEQLADQELIGKLQSIMGAEKFVRFQDLVIGPMRITGKEATPEAMFLEANRQLGTFDANKNNRLDAEEIEKLAVALDELPGGFGSSSVTGSLTTEFQQRLFRHYDPERVGKIACSKLPERMYQLIEQGDSNRDGYLTQAEVEGYVRKVSFDRVVESGIYIGGGFGDAFVERAFAINEIGLPDDKKKEAQALLDQHRERIKALVPQTLESAFRKFQNVVAQKPTK